MLKIPAHLKITPALQEVDKHSWYVVHIGVPRNMSYVESAVEEAGGGITWAPTYQVYKMLGSHLLLVDYLIYPGYIFVGLVDGSSIKKLKAMLKNNSKGQVLDQAGPLTHDELKGVFNAVFKYSTTPNMSLNIKVGSSVTITAGPFSGLPADVVKINDSGVVELRVFFLNRDMKVKTSVLDIKSSESM